MHSRRVHFAPTNRIYTGRPSIPSPSLSPGTSTSSSLGYSSPSTSASPPLHTPPPEFSYVSTYEEEDPAHLIYPTTPYWPRDQLWESVEVYHDAAKSTPNVHLLLAYHPHAPPPLDFDILHSPTTLMQPGQPRMGVGVDGKWDGDAYAHMCGAVEDSAIPHKHFSEPATNPPVRGLILRHPWLIDDIEVTPAPPAPFDPYTDGYEQHVTVADVLTSIYHQLRHPVHPLDYADLPAGARRGAVDAAYYVRTGELEDVEERAREVRKGIKKVDLLMGCTRFLGISATLEPGVWELNVA